MPTLKTKLFAIPIALWVIFSQIQCIADECEGISNPWFEQSNWQLIALDNNGEKPVPLTTNKAPMNAFGLGIKHATTITEFKKGLECGFEPELYPPGGVTKVLITCSQDFDPSHPAGVSLNDYFRAFTYSPSTNLPSYAEVSTANFNKYSETNQEVDFIMVQPPDHPGNYQFNVCLFFDYSPKCDSSFTTPVMTLY